MVVSTLEHREIEANNLKVLNVFKNIKLHMDAVIQL